MINRFITLVLLSISLCYGIGSVESQVPPETKKTQVVIIGTIHDKHYKNPKYSPEILKQIILSLNPDAILNELPLSQVDPNGRPLFRDPNKHPEGWVADTVATQLGIKQIPFDRPDREENFKKTNYFERQKRASKLANEWGEQIVKEDPNSVDCKIAQLFNYAGQAERHLFMNCAPEVINSEAHDSIIRIKHSLWYDILPTILKNYPGYETLIDDYHFERDQWQQRNEIMANNIIKAAKEYPGKRLVVITGATHRYILQDLLKREESIELKEYWEITPPEVNKPHEINEPNQPAYLKPIPPEKLKEDLDFLFKTIEEVHPNMYAYIIESEFEKYKKELYENIKKPRDKIELYKLVAPVICQLRFGHCNVFPPRFQEFQTQGKFIPLSFDLDGKDLIVVKNLTNNNVPENGKIIKINNQPVNLLIDRFSHYWASEDKVGDPYWAARVLAFLLWLENSSIDYYSLEIEKPDGKAEQISLKAITAQEAKAAVGEQESPKKEAFSYECKEDCNTVILDIDTLDSQKQQTFKDFLNDTFKKIQEKQVSALIIDLRSNGGGSSNLGDILLDYITDRPYRQFEKYNLKVSKQLLDFDAQSSTKKHNIFAAKDLKIGSFITQDIPYKIPTKNPLRFKGDVFLLIDHFTFSSAQDFAAAVKCFNIGTLIGEETGGATIEYGDVMTFTMPNSNLTFNVPCKYFVGVCGKPDGRGVIPDYEVGQKAEDTAKGVDTVLQFTLNLIKNSESEK